MVHVLPEYDYLYDDKLKAERFSLNDLKTALAQYNETETPAQCGIWEVHTGGYDKLWEVCKNGEPVVECIDNEISLMHSKDIPFDERDAIFRTICNEYTDVRVSPDEPWSQQDVMINDPKRFIEMVEAGEWRIEEKVLKLFEKASAPFTDDQLMLGDLGTVRFGNHSFNITIRNHAFTHGPEPSVTILLTQNVPLTEFGLNSREGQIMECDDLKIIKENNMLYPGDVSVNHYFQHEKLAWIKNGENILSDYGTFKNAICEKLFFEDMISTRCVEDYQYLKDSGKGYFQQLDKQLEEYPSRLAKKDKLACLDIDILGSYYSRQFAPPWNSKMGVKWDAKEVISHMVKSGFDNQQVRMLCTRINDLFKSSNQMHNVIDKALYLPERLNEMRDSLKSHSKNKAVEH